MLLKKLISITSPKRKISFVPVDDIVEENQELRNTIQQMSAELTKNPSSPSNSRPNRIMDEIAALHQQIKSLMSEHNAKIKEYDKLRLEFNSREKLISTQASTIKDYIQKEKIDEEKIHEMQGQLLQLLPLRLQNHELKREIDIAKDQLLTATEEKSSLEKKYEMLKSDFDGISEKYSKERSILDSASNNQVIWLDNIKNLREELLNAEQKLQLLNEEKITAERELQKVHLQLMEVLAKCETLERHNRGREGEIKVLKEETNTFIKELSLENASLRNQIRSKDDAILSILHQVKTSKQNIDNISKSPISLFACITCTPELDETNRC